MDGLVIEESLYIIKKNEPQKSLLCLSSGGAASVAAYAGKDAENAEY